METIIYEELERIIKKRNEDYFVKSHEMLMKARERRLQFKNDMKLGIIEKLACKETHPLLDDVNPTSRFLSEAVSTIARKENEQIEHILRNWIDDPIIGPITKESLKARCIRTILYKEPNEMDSKCEVLNNKVTITLTSRLIGVVQGDYLIGIDGQRSRLSDEQNRKLFKMGV